MEIFRFKILLMGAAAVGKTSLLHRFVDNTFAESYASTIGLNFLIKDMDLSNQQCRLTIWDLAGQDKFRFVRKKFYIGANGALLIWDLTRDETFNEIENWYLEMLENQTNEIPFILIGNKADLIKDKERTIEINVVKEYAEKKGSFYIETSAKTGEKVEEAFVALSKRMIDKKDSN